MQEILPGLYHWSTFHEPISTMVSSYYYEPAGLAIDPKIPEQGLEALPGRPEQVVLTIGLHDRDAAAFAAAFQAPIRVPEPALKRLGDSLDADPFSDGEELAPGVRAIAIGQIAPDEFALHISVAEGALAFADGLINYGGLGFVPDNLLGDDAATIKRGLIEAFRGLLDLEFDHLLFAHGDPLIGGGKAALREFVAGASVV
jgi:hypothetical protein